MLQWSLLHYKRRAQTWTHYSKLCHCHHFHPCVSQEMDLIFLCSARATISTLKLQCSNALRRWKCAPYLLFVCACVLLFLFFGGGYSNFPFRWAIISVQRLSQCPQFHGCSFRERREEEETAFLYAMYEKAGTSPPRLPVTAQTHLYSPHVGRRRAGGGWGGDAEEVNQFVHFHT